MRKMVITIAALALLCVAVAQQSGGGVADEIMAITKAQWKAENAGNTAEALKSLADDYTEFNGDFATRVEGKAQAMRISEGQAAPAGSIVVAEMANPKVQVYGDTAILSYNYMGVNKDKDGKTTNTRAKSTRVYVKKGGQWWLVHANFGADPVAD
jgi:ketosteroid isomerase-like protein